MRAKAEKNLLNARDLFDSYLNAIFSEKGEGWVERTLGEVADFKNGLNFTQSSKGEVIRIVGVKDFKNYLWVPMTGLETVQIEGALSPAYELQQNDILTVRSNGNKQLIGRCILAGTVEGKVSHFIQDSIPGPSIRRDRAEYLVRYLKSCSHSKLLIESGDGANISSLNQKALTALPVFYPKKDLQQEIVSRLEAVETESERMEAVCRQKLAAIAELKQSILQKAFAGEQSSERCRRILIILYQTKTGAHGLSAGSRGRHLAYPGADCRAFSGLAAKHHPAFENAV